MAMDGCGAALLAIPGQLIAGGACSYCKEWIGYVLNYEKNLKKVQEFRSQLEMQRNDIKAQADEEIRRENRVMAEEVSAWLDEATNLLETEVDWEDMLKDSKERKKAEQCCPAGFCSWNPKYRHHLSRIAKEKAAQIDEIKKRMTERASTQLTIPRTPPPFETDPANFCPDLKSRVEMLNLIIQKVRDDRVKIIAIHGMGGVGKTTLAEEVAKIADKEKWFSKVVMVEISNDPNIKKIQDQIAEQINFKGLADITIQRERAKRLREALLPKDNDNKKLLVVLDNIWDMNPTLYSLGIPDGCKFVLTSREKRVCLGMGAEANNIIQLHDLHDGEARDLLIRRVGQSIIAKENYEPILRELLENCPRLPLSICVLGDVLRSNQDLAFWRDAVRQLKSLVPTQADEVLLGKTYSVLKLSYDSIGNRDKRCFFLLCGLFKPGTYISITDLFTYGIGLGLFDNESSLDFAWERACKWANELKCSSLLTEFDYERHIFKIHDDIRAAVMIFAIQEDHMFHVGAISPLLKADAYEKHTAISVWSYANINSLIGRQLDKLQLFSLDDSPPRSKLADDFFIPMKNIKVLKLIDIKEMETLPSSIEHLESLRTLLLEDCTELIDISSICKLVKLRVLGLCGSVKIPKLPNDFGTLAELKFLNMTGCLGLEEIIAGTMMKLEQLESLHMSVSFSGWENGGSMASLSELQCLPHLRVLAIDIKNLKQLPDGTDFPPKNLSRFRISINSSPDLSPLSEFRRNFMLGDASADDVIKKGLKSLLRCAEYLGLEDVSNLENIIPYLCENDGLVNLRSINISGCQALKYLINPLGLSHGRSSHFHNLQELSLYHLETLQPYALLMENASRLRVLKVCDCEALEYIFWAPTNLETPEIQEATRSNKEIEFTSLKELKLTKLPRLLGFCSERNSANGTCRSLFTEKMKFPALETLEIDGLGKIMEVWDGRGNELSGAFPELQYLEIERCDGMEQVILIEDETAEIQEATKSNKEVEFTSLKELKLTELPRLLGFCSERNGTCLSLFTEEMKFPALETLEIDGLGKIMEVWDGRGKELSGAFPELHRVRLENCHNARHMWIEKLHSESEYFSFGVKKLQDLVIKMCDSMEQVILIEDEIAGGVNLRDKISFPNLSELTLFDLKSLRCFYRGKPSIEFPSLESLSLWFLFKMVTFTEQPRISKVKKTSKVLFNRQAVFPSLKTLVLWKNSVLTEMWDLSFEEFSIRFPIMEEVDLLGMSRLKHMWTNKRLCEETLVFGNLKELSIRTCKSFKSLFPPVAPSLVSMKTASFPVLHSLKLDNLSSFQCLIQVRQSLELSSLKELCLRRLPKLKRIVGMKSTGETMGHELRQDDVRPTLFNGKVSTPSLESLFLSSLTNVVGIWDISTSVPKNLKSLGIVEMPKLKCATKNSTGTEFQSLEELAVRNISTVKILFKLRAEKDEAEKGEHHSINTDPSKEDVDLSIERGLFVRHSVGFPNLRTLKILEMPKLERISDCEDEDDSPSNCSIFSESTTQNSTWLPSLKLLDLVGLPKLKHLSLSISSKLELLEIEDSFLGKESLITPRSILRGRSLQLLRKLTISDCKDMKAIIAKENSEEDEQQIEIVFPHLGSISLASMPLLHAFNAASYPIEAPVLKHVNIDGKKVAGNPNLNLNLLLEQHNDQLQATTISQPGVQYDRFREQRLMLKYMYQGRLRII